MDEHEDYFGSAAEFCKIIGAQKKPQSLSCKLFNRQRQLEKIGRWGANRKVHLEQGKQSSDSPLIGKCLYCGTKVTFSPTFD